MTEKNNIPNKPGWKVWLLYLLNAEAKPVTRELPAIDNFPTLDWWQPMQIQHGMNYRRFSSNDLHYSIYFDYDRNIIYIHWSAG